VKLWDWPTGREVLTLRGHTGRVNGLSFSPDGRHLATGSADRTIKVWDAATGKEFANLRGHTDSVSAVDYSPDGTRLVSSSADGTVKIWDWVMGEEGLTLRAGASDVAFSPDGSRIAGGGTIWDATPVEAASGPRLSPSVEQAHRENAAAADRFVADFPGNARGRFNAASLRNNLGVYLNDKCDKPAGAERVFREGIAILEALTTQFPQDFGYLSMLGGVKHNLGVLVFRSKGDLAPAQDLIEQAIVHQLKALQGDPDNYQHREFLHNHYTALGEIQEAAGESKSAMANLKKALDLVPDPEGGNAPGYLARQLVTCPDPADRDPALAIELVNRAIRRQPNEPDHHSTLGMAHYRAGHRTEAKAAIEKAISLSGKRIAADVFFLAMADWQLGHREAAAKEYAEAVAWMQANKPTNPDLRRFRTEAAELLGLKNKLTGAATVLPADR
jgi:tetratricopeptide (TPR) repeat protein